MAGTTLSTDLTAFLPNYWDTILGENLYPNLYFYQFGTKRTVPRNFGTSIKIPRLKKQNIIAAQTEGTLAGICPISDQFISGSMTQYAGAYRHSDILIMTALSDVIELSLIDIARDIARSMDTTVRDALSATGGSLSAAAALEATFLKPATIIESVVTLDTADNPRPPDNHYPTIIHPKVVYDLQNNLSGGAWLDVLKYQENESDRIYIGEVGRLYGARFITSSNIQSGITASSASGMSRSYMFAPDSYYVTEISDMTARTFVKQLGSGGTADPVNQQATVGAKVFFGVVPATWDSSETRMMRLKFTMDLDQA